MCIYNFDAYFYCNDTHKIQLTQINHDFEMSAIARHPVEIFVIYDQYLQTIELNHISYTFISYTHLKLLKLTVLSSVDE